MPPSTPEGTELVRKVAYHFSEIFTDDYEVREFFNDNLEHFEDEFEDYDEAKVRGIAYCVCVCVVWVIGVAAAFTSTCLLFSHSVSFLMPTLRALG